MKVSVIIPAHNEQEVIGRCLGALPLADLDVVVVCNGCTDRTAEVASAVHPEVRVERLPEASKISSLNHGDAVADHFPRLYLDADTLLRPGAIDALAEPLRSGTALVTSPMVEHNLSRSSWPVRSYYAIWSRLPSVGSDIVGCGAYALSAEGRRRFEEFPDLLGDDHFVREQFTPDERRVVPAVSVVRGPRTLRDLVRRKVRVFTGNRLVYQAQPGGRLRGRSRQSEWLGVVAKHPRLVVHVPVYVTVTAVAKALSRWRQRRGTHLAWGRDDSSRTETTS